jgi:hypothetical protein
MRKIIIKNFFLFITLYFYYYIRYSNLEKERGGWTVNLDNNPMPQKEKKP